MSIILDLATATLCFSAGCFPALVGQNTPTGEFTLQLRHTEQRGYGGSVLQFHETSEEVFAIHRPWLLRPEQRRLERLASNDHRRRTITGGCVNVSDDVYDALLACCQGQTITIRRTP